MPDRWAGFQNDMLSQWILLAKVELGKQLANNGNRRRTGSVAPLGFASGDNWDLHRRLPKICLTS